MFQIVNKRSENVSKSIISNKKECLVCKVHVDLHKHLIFYGTCRNRKRSEQYGCWCYLCSRHYNMSKWGVYANRRLDRNLRRYAQVLWENEFGSREKFVEVFGKSYLQGDK